MAELHSHLLRGGSWYGHPRGCRSAYRSRNRPDDAGNIVGFRVVCLAQGEHVIKLSVLPAPENG